MKESTFQKEFKAQASFRLDESTRMIVKTFKALDEADIWRKPNPSSNSIGNLILHLCGNISQYAISSLGGTDDFRNREEEFSAAPGYSRDELLERLLQVVDRAKTVISNCSGEELLRSRQVQGFTMSGIGIIVHVVEHYSYHTGQIAFWTKLLKDKDLGFYEGEDLNIKNI
ncbi:MAG TPA: DinB family protein [Eudoraea sp.]|nr:DinB family protein [Eudoraea sp.]